MFHEFCYECKSGYIPSPGTSVSSIAAPSPSALAEAMAARSAFISLIKKWGTQTENTQQREKHKHPPLSFIEQ
jgi:hypothetical protein